MKDRKKKSLVMIYLNLMKGCIYLVTREFSFLPANVCISGSLVFMIQIRIENKPGGKLITEC